MNKIKRKILGTQLLKDYQDFCEMGLEIPKEQSRLSERQKQEKKISK